MVSTFMSASSNVSSWCTRSDWLVVGTGSDSAASKKSSRILAVALEQLHCEAIDLDIHHIGSANRCDIRRGRPIHFALALAEHRGRICTDLVVGHTEAEFDERDTRGVVLMHPDDGEVAREVRLGARDRKSCVVPARGDDGSSPARDAAVAWRAQRARHPLGSLLGRPYRKFAQCHVYRASVPVVLRAAAHVTVQRQDALYWIAHHCDVARAVAQQRVHPPVLVAREQVQVREIRFGDLREDVLGGIVVVKHAIPSPSRQGLQQLLLERRAGALGDVKMDHRSRRRRTKPPAAEPRHVRSPPLRLVRVQHDDGRVKRHDRPRREGCEDDES